MINMAGTLSIQVIVQMFSIMLKYISQQKWMYENLFVMQVVVKKVLYDIPNSLLSLKYNYSMLYNSLIYVECVNIALYKNVRSCIPLVSSFQLKKTKYTMDPGI